MNTARKPWLYFTVVREPVDRFLSGFVDKCLRDQRRLSARDRCFGCLDDLHCVVERLYERARAFATGRRKGVSFDDIHFFPQSW